MDDYEDIILKLIIFFIIVIAYILFSPQKNIKKKNENYNNEFYKNDYERMKAEKHKICEKCGSSINVQVHHVVHKQFGGKDNKENLMYLCKDCHEKEHGYNFNDEKKEISSAVTIRKQNTNNKYQIIRNAIDTNTILIIKYKSPAYLDKPTEITIRKIKPLEIYNKKYVTSNGRSGYHVALKAFCFLRGEERNFIINRIIEILED